MPSIIKSPKVKKPREPKIIKILESLIKNIEIYREEIKELHEKEKEKVPFERGYDNGYINGLNEAINIIKKFEQAQYREMTKLLLKKMEKKLK